ncbi:MAG: class II aldolase/adducin family protein [Oscillospiraceae bacterium]|nr:class II aldolase/adducin family protein [Oscillospiraceae bacterium]
MYEENEARRLSVQAARRLLEAGLTARTWGNISARVAKDRFVITPSGLAYETLRPEQLVLMDLSGRVLGGGRPSSEKGIHADAYRLHPEVRFVIHTHQDNASVASTAGLDLTPSHPLLNGCVPCAAYGMPSTDRLRRAVAEQEKQWPESPAILLRSHGALCMGASMEDAFAAAEALETVCGEFIQARLGHLPRSRVPDWGVSQRRGDAFILTRYGRRTAFAVRAERHPLAAAIHAAIYQNSVVQYIAHETAPEVILAGRRGVTMRPMLDDLAQIAGVDIRCAGASPGQAAAALRNRNAVLLRGAGALCTGMTEDDVLAVRAILRKGCRAWLLADTVPSCRPLGRIDAWMQRTIYVMQYAKKKNSQ